MKESIKFGIYLQDRINKNKKFTNREVAQNIQMKVKYDYTGQKALDYLVDICIIIGTPIQNSIIEILSKVNDKERCEVLSEIALGILQYIEEE